MNETVLAVVCLSATFVLGVVFGDKLSRDVRDMLADELSDDIQNDAHVIPDELRKRDDR